MFKELSFMYDGKSSKDFGLAIASLESSNRTEYQIGIPLVLEYEKIKNRNKVLFSGVQTGEPLEFDLELTYISEDPEEPYLTRQTLGIILKWLTKKTFKEFKIIDEDYANVTYNCIFTNPRQLQYGNNTYGIKLTAVCDRPCGFQKYSISKVCSGTTEFSLMNFSLDNEDCFPEIEIEMTASGGNISISNLTSGLEEFKFTSLAGDEVIYINNENQEIVSSSGLNRNDNFNFNWFKISPVHVNKIKVIGNAKVTIRAEYNMPV